MSIDAIITMMMLPYTILLDKKEQDLEELYEKISITSDPIITLNSLKQNFNTDNYQVNVYKWEEPNFEGTTLEGCSTLPPDIVSALKNMKEKAMLKEGKQYVELTKEDIKNLFSIEKWREQQLNKIL
jgi:hypothetical protein